MVATRQFLVLLLVALNTTISSASICENTTNGYVCPCVEVSDNFNFSCNNLKIVGQLNAKSLTITCSQPDTESKIFDFKSVPALSHLPVDKISIYGCLPGNNSFSSMLNHFGVKNPISFSYEASSYMEEVLTWPLFSGLHTLEFLTIYSSKIAMDENIFLELTNLKHLRLESNRVTSLHKHVFRKLENLETLALINNEIKTYEVGTFKNLNKLQNLTLNGSQVTGKKESFEGLSSLTELRLLGKKFKILSIDVFINISNLTYFAIDNGNPNRPNGGSLRDHKFSLTDCGLELVPKNLFTNRTNMTTLNLRNNDISKLHDGIFDGLSNLQTLQLSRNNLSVISELIFRPLYQLKTLDLDNNHLTTIHLDAFVDTKQLRLLTLVNNNLLSIDFGQVFRFTEDLKVLDLSNNNLTILPDLRNKRNLTSLELSENKIESINDTDLHFESKGIEVHLNNNKIEKLAVEKWNRNSSVTLFLKDNPFKCDNCKLYNFIDYIKKDSHKISDSHQLLCYSPESMVNRSLNGLNVENFTCAPDASQIECPLKCQCFERVHDKTLIYNCSNANATEFPYFLERKLQRFLSIELYIEHNNLTELPYLGDNEKVTIVKASHNNIKEVKVENLPPNLQFLDLSHNKIQGLKEDICKALDKLNTTLALGNNPWSCACSFESVKMIEFIKRKNETILDLQATKCELGIISEVSGEIFHLCSQTIKVALMIVAFLSLLICTLGISYYRHQQFIKIWLYAHMPWLWFVDDEKLERDKKYDAFISYAHEDVDFAIDTIVDELENRRANLKICVHERDWVAGELIVDSISKSIAESRRTIIILSQNFIKSMWGQYEFNHAHQRSITEKRVRVVVIVYGDIGRMEDLNMSLQSYLKSNTYIKWGEKWFWDKLLYAIQQRA